MNTTQLKYFVEFAFFGSAEQAAAHLGISRTSVSRNIKRLEEELNAKLFTQAMEGIALTREGQICLQYARNLLKIEDDLRFDIAGDGVYQGKLDIAMGTSRSQVLLTNILPEFSRTFPNVSVQIHELCTNDIYNWLLNQKLDFAIVGQKEAPKGISYRYLMTERLVLVAPRDDPFAAACSYEKNGEKYIDINKFDRKPFILGYSTQKSRLIGDKLFQKVGISPHIVLCTSNNFNAAMLAYNGLAYALVPESIASRNSNYIKHYHLEPMEDVSWSIGIAWLSKNPLSHVACYLQELIIKKVGAWGRGQQEEEEQINRPIKQLNE